MTWPLAWMLFALVLWLLSTGLVRTERAYEFPFLAGLMAFSFLLPQIPSVAGDPAVTEAAFTKTLAMTLLCLVMLWLGWGSRRAPISFFEDTFSEKRLLNAALAMSLIGAFFFFQLSRMSNELTVGVQMSGTGVAYLFFARLMIYGLAIATLCYARRPSRFAGFIILFDLFFCIDRILVTGKRGEALEIVIIFALSFWFHRGWKPPRSALVAMILATTLVMSSLSDYRQITREDEGFDITRIAQIDLVENFQEMLASGGLELRNAVQRIEQIDRSGEFDYGAVHWNRLVFAFVPAQIVGTPTKAALYLPVPLPPRDYLPPTGTTETGMVDAFLSFWYFGALKFFLLAYVLSRVWASANAGSTTAQIVYMLSVVPAMHAISHITDWVLQVWVHMLVFLMPALLLAAARRRRPRRWGTPAMELRA
ncbi:oligosaccharide repeat unit polymerase [Mesorhizobium microcysteis]|uniref:Oligosaccharide repeat unit polymerase n=1 Tax=Neoaquamicrobium microcysteis TaxID=2682781 RepID=A0A5D4GUN7_9HYPH|nr:oligosaccharide repeat unit polymerase [Mesorhizobium microcysteis]TYR31623.1 oligosaccharide repeat unit polymerase [Mesorhizobium microcysteis]